jgi:hypothetical protein
VAIYYGLTDEPTDEVKSPKSPVSQAF